MIALSAERFAKKELLNMGGPPATRAVIPPTPGLIHLGTGDPDFNQPEFIAEAVYKAMMEGYTHYAFVGDPEFKRAIANYNKKFGINADPDKQVVLTSGGSQAVFQAFAAILNPGDEVIILDPAYTGYTQPAAYFGAKIVRANLTKDKNGLYRPDVENIEKVVTEKTKALMICNPDNPTGVVYTKKEIGDIAKLAVEKDFIVLDDAIYIEFVWGNRKYIPIINEPGMLERTMMLASFSKTFAWTGCRAGYIISGPSLAQLVDSVPVGTCSIPVPFQKAGIEALKKGWDFVEEMRKAYKERVDYCVERMNEIPRVQCPKPEGAFYLFPDISATNVPSAKFCEGLFREEKLRAVPGTAFGKNQ